jgi:hypothetical protein
MPQVFPAFANPLARISLLAVPLLISGTGVTLAAFYRSDYTTGRNEIVEQPVPFSHLHHVSQLGIDCRYCHTSVEYSWHPGYPPTKTCMNCHQQMWTGADLLAPVRASWQTDTPIAWNKVHNVPHYTYFNHSIHVNKGVSCYSCHDRIDQMPLVYQSKTLLMEWCIACHRNPEPHLRPKSEVFNLGWKPNEVHHSEKAETVVGGKVTATASVDYSTIDTDGERIRPQSQSELGRYLKDKYKIRDAQTLTNCSMCHR